ncbi:MAG: LEPR-XLL domain-containing protein [Phycisphaeraceae bacterium]|nr:LEPR-XLL domain-containing protein [Phycisphaeraceae bacterium]
MLTRLFGQLRGSARVESSHASTPAAPAGLEPLEPRLLLSAGDMLSSLALKPVIEKPTLSVTLVDSDSTADESGNDAAFRVTRLNGSFGNSGDLAFTFSFSGSAAKNDFLVYANKEPLTTTTAVIPDGDSFIDLVIVPVDDASPEPTEAVTLTLKTGKNYNVDYIAKSATINILDNEPALSVSLVSGDDSANESGDTAAFRITRTGSTFSDLPVAFSISGTAGANKDFTLAGYGLDPKLKSAVISAGQSYVDILVTPINDPTPEPTETVKLTLAKGKLFSLDPAASSATISILDNEPTVSVTVYDDKAVETTSLMKWNTAHFRVTRDADDLSAPLTVGITLSGNATAGASLSKPGDYLLYYLDDSIVGTKNVVIPAGQAYVDFYVVPTDDSKVEKTETVVLSLKNNPKLYTLDKLQAKASATIDDLAIPFVGVKISRIIAAERNPSQPANQARFNFTRQGGDLSQAVTVYFHVSGEAFPGLDYTLRNSAGDPITLDPDLIGSVTFAPGQKTTTVDLVAIDDLKAEDPRESAILTLLPDDGGPSYALTAKTADRSATAFVTDYEVAPEDIDGLIVTVSSGGAATTLLLGENHSIYFTIEKDQVWGGQHYHYTKTSSTAATLIADVYGETTPVSINLTFKSPTSGSLTGTDDTGEPFTGSFKTSTPKGAYAYDDINGGTFTGKITSASDPTEVKTLTVAEFGVHTFDLYQDSVFVASPSYTYEKIAPNFGFILSGGDDNSTWSLLGFALPSQANIYSFNPEEPDYPWQIYLNGSFNITI